MDDADLDPRPFALIALAVALVLVSAGLIAFGLLRYWQLAPGGETGSAAWVAQIPMPRLQTAPQQDRAEGRAASGVP
jgi:hypothetical protein